MSFISLYPWLFISISTSRYFFICVCYVLHRNKFLFFCPLNGQKVKLHVRGHPENSVLFFFCPRTESQTLENIIQLSEKIEKLVSTLDKSAAQNLCFTIRWESNIFSGGRPWVSIMYLRGLKFLSFIKSKRLFSRYSNSRHRHPLSVKAWYHLTILCLLELQVLSFLTVS